MLLTFPEDRKIKGGSHTIDSSMGFGSSNPPLIAFNGSITGADPNLGKCARKAKTAVVIAGAVFGAFASHVVLRDTFDNPCVIELGKIALTLVVTGQFGIVFDLCAEYFCL